ncbi:MAG: type II toxin-antitoxin system VapC family toxin [Halobacteriota archaeon]
MTLSDELRKINTIFVDTAPIIYYIEAHPDFGPIAKEVVDAFQSGVLVAYSSVITLAEVLPQPIRMGREELARKFVEFLRKGRNFYLIEISVNIAERAGRLRGKYPILKALDAVQLATALDVKADAFLTNDSKLNRIREVKVLVLKDYL